MENASKALIMAGSILLSLLVITSLVWMIQSIRGWKQAEDSSKGETTLTEYNKKIEAFNKAGLYGSEIMSLANLIEDYNYRQVELKGYSPITLIVKINSIQSSDYFQGKNYNQTQLIEEFKKLENKINTSSGETQSILKSDLTEFKNKYFKNAPAVEYDTNGRISKMTFSEN